MPKEVHVLVIDDDDADQTAMVRGFGKHAIAHPLHFAGDGIEALEMLRGEHGRARIPRPYLILLDLNMPRMDGIEFLRELRSDPDHRSAVVFVMTTSRSDREKLNCYEFNIAGYIVKNNLAHDFSEICNLLDLYGKVVDLPDGEISRPTIRR